MLHFLEDFNEQKKKMIYLTLSIAKKKKKNE